MSPFLFNVLVGDIEEALGRDKVGGVRIGGEKLKVLGYADDSAFDRKRRRDEMVVKEAREIL